MTLDGGSARAPFDHAHTCYRSGSRLEPWQQGFSRFPIQWLSTSLRFALLCDQFTDRLQLGHARIARSERSRSMRMVGFFFRHVSFCTGHGHIRRSHRINEGSNSLEFELSNGMSFGSPAAPGYSELEQTGRENGRPRTSGKGRSLAYCEHQYTKPIGVGFHRVPSLRPASCWC